LTLGKHGITLRFGGALQLGNVTKLDGDMRW